MKDFSKKAVVYLLICLLAMFLTVPTAAGQAVGLFFNGQEYQADLYLEDGVSYISTASLAKIPGLGIAGEGEYVPLRSFFEERGGNVHWVNADWQVIVNWRDKKGAWTADELVMETTRILQEYNSYRMEGSASMKMNVTGPDMGEIPEMPKMSLTMKGVFQQEPMLLHMQQAMEFPFEEMGLSEEEIALFGQDAMLTEIVWRSDAIYQKTPLSDQWIVEDLGDMEVMESLTRMLQLTPQQSLEMLRNYGIVNVFGEDVYINGEEYYTIKNYIDSATFKQVMEEFMHDFDIMGLIADTQEEYEQDRETDAMMEEIQLMFEQLMDTIELDYYVYTYINKDTLLSEHMKLDMVMKYEVDETLSPEGPVSFEMKMNGEFKLYDFGTEVVLPDVSDAITQQEFMEQMMGQ